jgi:iron complex outermembrane receptor protein
MNGKDMIDWVYETSKSTKYHAMNIGKLDNMGASIDATINFNELLGDGFLLNKIKVGYAYIHQKHETELPIYKSLYALEYLRQKFVMQVEHRIWRSLSANWALRWQERMNGYSPYTKIDGRIQWTAKNYKIYLKADNITAHRYYDLGAVRQPGIWIMAGCAVNLDF